MSQAFFSETNDFLNPAVEIRRMMMQKYRLWIRCCLSGIDKKDRRGGINKAKATAFALLAAWGLGGFGALHEACAQEGIDLIAGARSKKKVHTHVDRKYAMQQAEEILLQYVQQRRQLHQRHEAELEKDAKRFDHMVTRQEKEENRLDAQTGKKLATIIKKHGLKPVAKDRDLTSPHLPLDESFLDNMPNPMKKPVKVKHRLKHGRFQPDPSTSGVVQQGQQKGKMGI